MKRFYYALFFCSFCILSINCQKEISFSGLEIPGPGNNNPAPVEATILGNVLDENGNPAAGVVIKVGNKSSTTDSKGYFRITAAALDKNASLVVAKKTGYFNAYRTFNATTGANYIKIKLVKKTSAGTINAATGGNVTLTNGTKIELPVNGVVKTSGGNLYSGSINVYASYIDPTAVDMPLVVPGSFMADDKGNKRVVLESYGMLAVELETSASEKLQISPGSVATITSPIPASLRASAPASIALWYVDEQTGLWKEEGDAVRNGDSYVGTVSHFSFWNCDIGIPLVRLSATLNDAKGLPVSQVMVRVKRLSNPAFHTYAWSDSLGQINGLVPSNESLVFELMGPCNNVVFSKSIGPLSSDINLGPIVILSSISNLITVEGQLKDCNNSAVTHGYAIINYDNTTWQISVDNNGRFRHSFLSCSNIATKLEIFGVDHAGQQQSSPVMIPVTNPITTTGQILACGNSAIEYINYEIDDIGYMISSSSNDSLLADTYQGQTESHLTWITGDQTSGGASIGLNFGHEALPGTYDVIDFGVSNYDSLLTIVRPFTVTISKHARFTGEFYEGSFSGQFKDLSAALHRANGTFRVRRR